MQHHAALGNKWKTLSDLLQRFGAPDQAEVGHADGLDPVKEPALARKESARIFAASRPTGDAAAAAAVVGGSARGAGRGGPRGPP